MDNDSSTAHKYANQSHIEKRRRRRREDVVRVVVVAAFAFLEAAPWSYACGVAIAGLHHLGATCLAQWQRAFISAFPSPTTWKICHLHPPPRADLNVSSSSRDSKLRIFILAVVGMLLCWTCGYVPINIPGILPVSAPGFRQSHSTWSTSSTRSSSAISVDGSFVPGMHIVMLTVPRDRDPSSDYMIDSVASYLDAWKDGFPASSDSMSWSNATSMLTVYAHPGQNGRHQGFERAETFFRSYPASSEFVPQPLYAPLDGPALQSCELDQVRSSMTLKASRSLPRSGLILHHTLLPTLAHLLNGDGLIQHCLNGDGLCGSLFPSLGTLQL